MYLEFIILLSILLFAFYKWSTFSFDTFEKRKIPFLKPVPLFGNMLSIVLGKQAMFDLVIEYYNQFNCKVFGIYDQRKPLVVIKDPAIIKQITVKEFDHFINHRPTFGTTDDNDESNFFGSSLFAMTNAKWKDMRSTLSPSFTSSKMKSMFQLINQVAEDTFEKFKELPEVKNSIELDIKDYATRFTNDIIASTAFGIQVNSVDDRDNEFYNMGKRMTTFTTFRNVLFFFYANFRSIMKFFKISVFDVEASKYFRDLVVDTMKYRMKNNISRPDVINMLMEASGMIPSDNENIKQREWTEFEIVAQCLIFFFAGFETVSILLCFTAHELMENPEVQERLYEEIKEVSDSLNGEKLSYEKLQSMKYLDMVISETLRKWPPAIALDRMCNKDFSYTDDSGNSIDIKLGDGVWIPVAGIHRDPKYYPNPMKFDPERFNDDNKNNIDPFTYMPFGVGPRICIANRFALLEAKAYIFYLIRAFKVQASAKTETPINLHKSFQLKPINGFWLKLVPRK